MVFCATTVSLVSGAMAERIKLCLSSYLQQFYQEFISNRNGLAVGGGWLASLGFDFAGSTLVHQLVEQLL